MKERFPHVLKLTAPRLQLYFFRLLFIFQRGVAERA
jgi:hypothetical protein